MVGRRDRALLYAQSDGRGKFSPNAQAHRRASIACPTVRSFWLVNFDVNPHVDVGDEDR